MTLTIDKVLLYYETMPQVPLFQVVKDTERHLEVIKSHV